MQPFSYAEYAAFMKSVQAHAPLLDYGAIHKGTKEFCILRHDVEFSIERAYDLAVFEHEQLGIRSSFFFQLRNGCYNILAERNLKLLRKMKKMGHFIGLHFHASGVTNFHGIEEDIKRDIAVMQQYLGFPVDRFSFHRPHHDLLKKDVKISGAHNAYGPEFFHFFQGPKPAHLRVKYVADSNHQWKWGHPLDIVREGAKKAQIVTHPFSWTKNGKEHLTNMKTLLQEKDHTLKKNIRDELKNFPVELLEDEKPAQKIQRPLY